MDQIFVSEILSKFSGKATSQLCTRDPFLIEVGKRLWQKTKRKVDKRAEVRKSVMSDMRRLACLYTELETAESELGILPCKQGNITDLFARSNFSHLEKAIETYTTDPNNTSSIKSGLKVGVQNLLKTTSKILKGLHLMNDEDEKAADIDKFVTLLELNQDYIFGDAVYAANQVREAKLRRSKSLPEEKDIQKVKEYAVNRIQEIVQYEYEVFDNHLFIELRDLAVCRLTLFNARRGGEPSRLRRTDWIDADKEAWIDKQRMKDPLDKALATHLKISFFSGKGMTGKHLVPCLFPEDTHAALNKLSDAEVRSSAGLAEDNISLFPSTNDSSNHVSGWHALNKVCKNLDLKNEANMTATQNRNRVSTLFALMDIPENERQYVYRHLGHSEETNRDIYQAPLAGKEISVVGRRLLHMDGGKVIHVENY